MPISLPTFMLPDWMQKQLEGEGTIAVPFKDLPSYLQNYITNASAEEEEEGVPPIGEELPAGGPMELATGGGPLGSAFGEEVVPPVAIPQRGAPSPAESHVPIPPTEKLQPRVPPPVTPTPPGVIPVEKPDFGMIIGVLQEQLKQAKDPDAAARISKEIREAYKALQEEAAREVVEVPTEPVEAPVEPTGREVVEVPVEPAEVGAPVAGRPMIPEEETHVGELREVVPPEEWAVEVRALLTVPAPRRTSGLARLAEARGTVVSPEDWQEYARNVIEQIWADPRQLWFVGALYNVRKQMIGKNPKKPESGKSQFREYLKELLKRGMGKSGASAEEAEATIPFLVDVLDRTMEANPEAFERVVQSMQLPVPQIEIPRAKGGFAHFVTSLATSLGRGAFLPVQLVGAVTGERGKEFARRFTQTLHTLEASVSKPEGVIEKLSGLAGNLLGFAVSLMPWSRAALATRVPQMAARVAQRVGGPKAARFVGETVWAGMAFAGAGGPETPKEAGKQFVTGGSFVPGKYVGRWVGRMGARGAAGEAAPAGHAPTTTAEKLGGLGGESVAGVLAPLVVGEHPTPEQMLEMGALPFVMEALYRVPRVYKAFHGQLQNNIIPTLQRLGDRVHSIAAEMANDGTWKVVARLKDGALQHLATLPKEAGALVSGYGKRAIDIVTDGLARWSRDLRRAREEGAPATEGAQGAPTRVEVEVGEKMEGVAEVGKPATEVVQPPGIAPEVSVEGTRREAGIVGVEPPSPEELAKLREEQEVRTTARGRVGTVQEAESRTEGREFQIPEMPTPEGERIQTRRSEVEEGGGIPRTEALSERLEVSVRGEGETSPAVETVPAREGRGVVTTEGAAPAPTAPTPTERTPVEASAPVEATGTAEGEAPTLSELIGRLEETLEELPVPQRKTWKKRKDGREEVVNIVSRDIADEARKVLRPALPLLAEVLARGGKVMEVRNVGTLGGKPVFQVHVWFEGEDKIPVVEELRERGVVKNIAEAPDRGAGADLAVNLVGESAKWASSIRGNIGKLLNEWVGRLGKVVEEVPAEAVEGRPSRVPPIEGERPSPTMGAREERVSPEKMETTTVRERRPSLAEVVDRLKVPADLLRGKTEDYVLRQEDVLRQVRKGLGEIAGSLQAVVEAGGSVSGLQTVKGRGAQGVRVEVTLPEEAVKRLKERGIIVERDGRTFLAEELKGGTFASRPVQDLVKAWLGEMAEAVRGKLPEVPPAPETPRWNVEDIVDRLLTPGGITVGSKVENYVKNQVRNIGTQLLKIAEVGGEFTGIRRDRGQFFLQFRVPGDRVEKIKDITLSKGIDPEVNMPIVELKDSLSGTSLSTPGGQQLLGSFVNQFLDIASGRLEPFLPPVEGPKKKEAEEAAPEPGLKLNVGRNVELQAKPLLSVLDRAEVPKPPIDPAERLTNVTITLKRGAFSVAAESAREPGKRISLVDDVPFGDRFVKTVEALRDSHFITADTANKLLHEAARRGSAAAKKALGEDVDPGMVETESMVANPELVFGSQSVGEGPAVAREAMGREFSAVTPPALPKPPSPPALPKPSYWSPKIEEPSEGGPVRPWTTEYQVKVLAGIGRVLHPFGEAADRILDALRRARVSIMLGNRLVRADAFLQVTKAKAELMQKFDLNKREMDAIDRQSVEVATLVDPVWDIKVDPNTGDLVFDISDWQPVTRHRAGVVSSQKAFERSMEKQGFVFDPSKGRWVDPNTGREYWFEEVTIGNIKKLQVYVDPSKTEAAQRALELLKRGAQPDALRTERALHDWVKQYKEFAKYLEMTMLEQAGLEGYVPTVTRGVPDHVRGFGQPVAPERKYRKGMGTLPERLSDAMMMLRSDFGLEALHKYHAAEVLSNIGSVVAVVPGRTTRITKEFIDQLARYDRVNTRYGLGRVVAVDHQRGKVLVMLDPRPGEVRDKPVMRTIDLNKPDESLEKLEREKQLGILLEFAGNGEKRRQAVGDYAEALFISKGASPEEALRSRRVIEDIAQELVGSYEQVSPGAPPIFRPRVIWSEFVAPKSADVRFEGDVAKFVRAGGRIVPEGTVLPEGYRTVGHGWVLYALPPDTLKLFRQLGDGVLEKESLVYGALRWVTDKMRLGYVTQLATAVRDVVTTLYSTLYLKSFKDTLSGITARLAGAVPDFVTAEASALAPFHAGWRVPGYLVDAAREGWKQGAPHEKRLYLLRSLVDTVQRDVAFIEQGKGLDPVSRAFVVMYSFVRMAADISAQATGIAAELWKRGYEIGRRELGLDRPSARQFATQFADWAPAVIGRQDPVWRTEIGGKVFEIPAEKIRDAYTRAVEESAHWRYTGDDLAVPLEEAARSKIARLLFLYPRFVFITLQYLMSTPFRWLPYINARKFELPSNLRDTLRDVVRRYPEYFDEYYNIEKVQPRALEELTKAPGGRKVQEIVEATAVPLAVYLSGVVLKQLAGAAGYDLDFRFGPKTEDERKEARLRGVYYPAMVFRNRETGEETWVGIGSLNSIVLVASAVMSLQDLYRDLRIMMAREYGIPYTDEDITQDFTDLGPHLEAMFKQYGISPGVQFFVELVQAPFRPGQLGRAARTFGAAVARLFPLAQTARWFIDPRVREYVNWGTGETGFVRGFAAEFPGLSLLLPERRPPVGRVEPMPRLARALGIIGYKVSPEQITLARLGVGYPAAPPKSVDEFIKITAPLVKRVYEGEANERDLERYVAVADTYDRIMEILNDPNVSDAGIRKWRAQKAYEEYRARVMQELRSGYLEERRAIARELMQTQSPDDLVLKILDLSGGPQITESLRQRIIEPIYEAKVRNLTDLVNREEPIEVLGVTLDPRGLGRDILNYIMEQRGLRRQAEKRAAAR